MATLTDNIISIITNQITLYEELLEISEEKKDALVNKDTPALNTLVAKETGIVRLMQKLENAELRLLSDISLVINTNVQFARELIDLLPKKEDKEAFQFLTEKRINIAVEIKKANEQNAKLLDSALTSVDFTLNLMYNQINNSPVVCDARGVDITVGRRLFDAKQ